MDPARGTVCVLSGGTVRKRAEKQRSAMRGQIGVEDDLRRSSRKKN